MLAMNVDDVGVSVGSTIKWSGRDAGRSAGRHALSRVRQPASEGVLEDGHERSKVAREITGDHPDDLGERELSHAQRLELAARRASHQQSMRHQSQSTAPRDQTELELVVVRLDGDPQ